MINLSRYRQVNDMVHQLTENGVLQTYFTLYLMTESEEQRGKMNADFTAAWKAMPSDELTTLRTDFTECFKKLLPLIRAFRQEVADFKAEVLLQKQAA